MALQAHIAALQPAQFCKAQLAKLPAIQVFFPPVKFALLVSQAVQLAHQQALTHALCAHQGMP